MGELDSPFFLPRKEKWAGNEIESSDESQKEEMDEGRNERTDE